MLTDTVVVAIVSSSGPLIISVTALLLNNMRLGGMGRHFDDMVNALTT